MKIQERFHNYTGGLLIIKETIAHTSPGFSVLCRFWEFFLQAQPRFRFPNNSVNHVIPVPDLIYCPSSPNSPIACSVKMDVCPQNIHFFASWHDIKLCQKRTLERHCRGKNFASGSSLLTRLQQTRLLQDPLLQQGWLFQQQAPAAHPAPQQEVAQRPDRHLPRNSFPWHPRGLIASKCIAHSYLP